MEQRNVGVLSSFGLRGTCLSKMSHRATLEAFNVFFDNLRCGSFGKDDMVA